MLRVAHNCLDNSIICNTFANKYLIHPTSSLMKGERLGEFEELVLLAACNLHPDAYGVSIQETLHTQAQRSASLGAIYAALDRLQRKGYVDSWVGGATRQRGGRRKRFYQVTAAGLTALAESRAVRERLWRGLEDLGLAGGLAT